MAIGGLLASLFLFTCLASACYGLISFSDLKKAILITASPNQGQVLKAGEANITVTWGLDPSFTGPDSSFKTVAIKLCYAPISQKDRPWRKTEEHVNKDKTCQHKIVTKPYTRSNTTFTWPVKRDTPEATYFIRAYASDENEHEVAYGQTTNDAKTTNLLKIQAISGRHASLDIASVCFSAFSVVSLFFFFFLEKRKGKTSAQK